MSVSALPAVDSFIKDERKAKKKNFEEYNPETSYYINVSKIMRNAE